MSEQSWYPYAPDQAFGRGIADDERILDRLLHALDATLGVSPRAGNKAGATRPVPSPLPLAAWLGVVAGRATDGHGAGVPAAEGPVTTAIALDAAVRIRVDAPTS